MTDGVRIIWPERRFVSAEQIETWFADAVSNNMIASDRLSAKTIGEKAMALEDTGTITLDKKY